MRISVRKLFDQNGNETGSILSAILNIPASTLQKYNIENSMIQYAFNSLYPGQGLNIYRDMYLDTPSITVIKQINNLPEIAITI